MVPRVCSVRGHESSDYSRLFIFFFNDTATTEIYTLSLHDALPISVNSWMIEIAFCADAPSAEAVLTRPSRSEEHTSELQSHHDLVCRLLLDKKKKSITTILHTVTNKNEIIN